MDYTNGLNGPGYGSAGTGCVPQMLSSKREASTIETAIDLLSKRIEDIDIQGVRIKKSVFTPRPCEACDSEKPPIPLTVNQHIYAILNRVDIVSRDLSNIADVLERNLGGLKIE